MARMSDEEIREELGKNVGTILGSENRYDIRRCSFSTEGIWIECQILYKQEDGSFQGTKIGDKELCHIYLMEFDTGGFNEWTAHGTFRLDYSKIDYSSDEVLEKLNDMDYTASHDWNYDFDVDPDEDDCINVEITGDDMSSDKDDIPRIQDLNSQLAEMVDDIYNEDED